MDAIGEVARAKARGEVTADACAVCAAGMVLALRIDPARLVAEAQIISATACDIIDRQVAEKLAKRGAPS